MTALAARGGSLVHNEPEIDPVARLDTSSVAYLHSPAMPTVCLLVACADG
jgi:hypothetical protein